MTNPNFGMSRKIRLRLRRATAASNLAAQAGNDRTARNTQERMRIRRRGRNHDVLLAAEPQDCGGDEHQHAGNAERERGPEMRRKIGIRSEAKNEPKLMIQ